MSKNSPPRRAPPGELNSYPCVCQASSGSGVSAVNTSPVGHSLNINNNKAASTCQPVKKTAFPKISPSITPALQSSDLEEEGCW